MSAQLSPDGQYYWDGTKWVRAVSADGSWRWDGTAWRPARRPANVNAQAAALIAGGVVAALILAGVGYVALSRVFANVQHNVHSAVTPACTTTGSAGHALAQGDSLCGRELGSPLVFADCTTQTSLPTALVAEMTSASGGSTWTPANVGMDSGGCEMVAQPDQNVAIDSTEVADASVVLVADFVPADATGSLGVRIACSQDGSCLDVMLNGDETYSLAEGVPNADWKTLKEGSLANAYLRYGHENRLIIRFAGGVVSVFLNGYEVTHAQPDIPQESGYYGFYVDNGDSKPERVQLHRMYVFQAL